MAKPDLYDRHNPEYYAKESVKKALGALSLDIDKVNKTVSQAKQNELIKTAAPAINVLAEKSGARQSQAERALLSLGCRLDQHGTGQQTYFDKLSTGVLIAALCYKLNSATIRKHLKFSRKLPQSIAQIMSIPKRILFL